MSNRKMTSNEVGNFSFKSPKKSTRKSIIVSANTISNFRKVTNTDSISNDEFAQFFSAYETHSKLSSESIHKNSENSTRLDSSRSCSLEKLRSKNAGIKGPNSKTIRKRIQMSDLFNDKESLKAKRNCPKTSPPLINKASSSRR